VRVLPCSPMNRLPLGQDLPLSTSANGTWIKFDLKAGPERFVPPQIQIEVQATWSYKSCPPVSHSRSGG
jgi:hypothetical protein